ncbi:hypothetical protein BY996DRAFT_6429933 [Phakopsora pachyrhizi]|uniref:Uncharacterized protein n=1 Tax=Phakopsora pachyrhizi TaxID=170000 RepID=A0AAV0AU98_PHAPC|nr:hypothetical protein BY996DRAFT_6429933 [Phakopsora pachyrhizi]CAH7671894.1 hypothetical protein PPACK8108_LOCUS6733 [Phakopsora pachyrhizi]
MDQRFEADRSNVIQLLNWGDQLTQQFQSQYNHSVNQVESLQSIHQQYVNLSNRLKGSDGSVTGNPSISEQDQIQALNQSNENLLESIRQSLGSLESTVDQISELLLKVDIFLSEPTQGASIGFDPLNAFRHLSEMFSAYQAELLSKRELFSSFSCEEIDVKTFVEGWKTCDEIKALTRETMEDLADVMTAAWST